MPTPWLFNQWACNPFAAEPDRDAALTIDAMGIAFETTPEDVVVTPLAPAADEPRYSVSDWYASLTADWPTVANVIPKSQHVFKSDEPDVLAFVNGSLAEDQQRTSLQCFDYANYQIYVAGYRPSGPPAVSPESLLVVHEYPGPDGVRTELQLEAMVEAVEYLKATLLAETPVLIGIRLKLFQARPNERRSTPYIEPTNHFVVAVGMGRDERGPYVSFFDYYHEHAERDRLYLQPSLLMNSAGDFRTLTEVRRSRSR
jgi:hypothetical protein